MTEIQNVALGIVHRDKHVLMIERRNKERGRNGELLGWVFPGGKIEADETPFKAVEREVHEETGLYVAAEQTLDVIEHPTFPAHIHYIACALADRRAEKVADRSVIQAKWIPVAKLATFVTSSLNPAVSLYLEG